MGDTYNRLIIKQQQYKSLYFVENKRDSFTLYDDMFSIDYGVENSKYKFIAELPFSYLHWKLIDLMKDDPTFNF